MIILIYKINFLNMNDYKSIDNIEKENKSIEEGENVFYYKLGNEYLEEEKEEEDNLLMQKKDFLMNDLNAFIKELDSEEEIKKEEIELKESFGKNEENEEKIEENKTEKDLMPKKKGKKYKDINDFISKNVDNKMKTNEKINVNISMFYSWINIKIIGTIFMTLYFIGILEIIGLLNTLGKEIKDSLLFKLDEEKNKRETNFYQNYISENLSAPSFNMFFLSSIFSDTLINLLTFPGTILLLFVIVSCIIYFGVGNFIFLTGDSLNAGYSFEKIMVLILMYIGIYIFIGAIALVHHDIINKGYYLFDKQYLNKTDGVKNGYIFAYLFSMVLSSIIKMILDENFVVYNIKLILKDKQNTNNSNMSYYVIIIIIYLSSTISSLIFYFIYNRIFVKTKEHGDDNSHEVIKVFGYFIYCQTEGGICKNCVDCQKLVKKCSRCLGFYNCECCLCCYCCCTDYDEAEDGQKQLCIIYKLKGICSWIGDLLTGLDIIIFVLIIYGFELINIGFNPALTEFLDRKEKEEEIEAIEKREILAINAISFASRLLFYFLNLSYGFLHFKLDKKFKKYYGMDPSERLAKTEFNLIYESITFFAIILIILNSIISGVFAFQETNDTIYYFIPISISVCEYAYIILIYYSKGSDFNPDLIKRSFAISFYKMIFAVIKFFIDQFKFDIKNLVIFQFIFECIVMGICIVSALIFFIPNICISCFKGKN